jgi:broad specificity phosphatase PhoE
MGNRAPAEHDLPLTAVGKLEALKVRDYFADDHITISAVYSSSYQRAVQTAEPTAQAFKLLVQKRDDLCERRWGSMGVLTWSEAEAELREMSIENRHRFVPEGGESWADMEVRSMKVIDEILHKGVGDVAVFTHGGVLRGLLPTLAGVSKSEHERFTMRTGGIAKFDSERGTVEIL